jgi:hypothetical protein
VLILLAAPVWKCDVSLPFVGPFTFNFSPFACLFKNGDGIEVDSLALSVYSLSKVGRIVLQPIRFS